MNINSHLLGDHLKELGVITHEQLQEVLAIQEGLLKRSVFEPGVSSIQLVTQTREQEREVPLLGQILLEKKYISKDILDPVLAMQHRQIRELRMLSSEKLAMVIQIGFLINSTHGLGEVLSLIMKYANILTCATASTLMLLDEQTGELVFSIPTGPNADELKDIRIAKGVGVAGWVAENQQHVIIENAENDPRFYSGVDDMTGTRTRSILCVPLRSKRKTIGVLEVMNKEDNTSFTEDDALLLNLLSHQAAIAIENAILISSNAIAC